MGTKVLSFLATRSASAVLTFDELGVSGRFVTSADSLSVFDLVLGIPLWC